MVNSLDLIWFQNLDVGYPMFFIQIAFTIGFLKDKNALAAKSEFHLLLNIIENLNNKTKD